MTGPLKTWIIHFSFSCFYTVIQGVLHSYTGCILFSLLLKPIFPYEMTSYQNPIKYCNMAIYCNTLKCNMQYGINPYCFTPSASFLKCLNNTSTLCTSTQHPVPVPSTLNNTLCALYMLNSTGDHSH